MNELAKPNLYELLPAVYRIRDAEQGYPLRGLLEVIAQQAKLIRQDIDGLWDDLFIETCAPWVIPYIGELVGNEPIYDVASRRRADVARTIYYRRRKGTLPMLEELARDVTGWSAHAVAMFEQLGWTQHLEHLRFHSAWADLRSLERADRIDGPFDELSHTVDVRQITHEEGWQNIRNVAFFLWRLQNYPLLQVDASQAALPNQHGYHCSPLGNPAPLFNQPGNAAEETGLVGEVGVAGAIRPLAFYQDTEAYRAANLPLPPGARPPNSAYYGPERSLHIVKDGVPVLPLSILCKDLRDWAPPPTGLVAVDVARGRLAFAAGEEPGEGVLVCYNYGFSANLGGGPYDRRRAPDVAGGTAPSLPDTISDPDALDGRLDVVVGLNALGNALAAWDAAGQTRTVIQIEDSRTYQEDLAFNLSGPNLVIQAANGTRPVLSGDITVTGIGGASRLTLNGLVIAGSLMVEGSLGELVLAHCTLVPGRRLGEDGEPESPGQASLLVAESNDRLRIEIDHCITGALRIPESVVSLSVKDSIIDSATRGGRAAQIPVLISGVLAPFPALAATPALEISIGDEGPFQVSLAAAPAGLAQAASALEAAIQAAHPSPAFTAARVLTADDRLVVVPGIAAVVEIARAGSDTTAIGLRLDEAQARSVLGLLSGVLLPFPALTSAAPELSVTIGSAGTAVATLAPPPNTLAQAATRLQDGIRSASAEVAFTEALTLEVDNRLLILPGADGAAVVMDATAADPTTLMELGLENDRPALSASAGGEQPGPPATLERVTIFGSVHLKELALASEVIFDDRVTAQRRQAGCVRFSYVPPGSRTPRRYRCQPDLAAVSAVDARRALDPLLTAAEETAIGATVQRLVVPAFSARSYGLPAYAQLAMRCPCEIRTGAADGSEMGAFCELKQPQREANLRVRLEEYLPFGLEAGIIYVT